MKYTLKIQKAIKFSIKTHEVYQKQKRKGKDVAYITHPLTVGLILSLAGSDEDVVVAGILHDTIEDSTQEKKVTVEMVEERFGRRVSELVLSVTENYHTLDWDKRKKEAIGKIKHFSKDSLLIKSADLVSNNTELIDDYIRNGSKIFEEFHASGEKIVKHHIEAIEAVLFRWKENPLARDLIIISEKLKEIID